MDFCRIFSQRNTKVVNPKNPDINPLNLYRVWIHWIYNPFLDFAKETKNPFSDSESGLEFSQRNAPFVWNFVYFRKIVILLVTQNK